MIIHVVVAGGALSEHLSACSDLADKHGAGAGQYVLQRAQPVVVVTSPFFSSGAASQAAIRAVSADRNRGQVNMPVLCHAESAGLPRFGEHELAVRARRRGGTLDI